jgi:hypothetical protein
MGTLAVFYKPGIGEYLFANGISLQEFLNNLAAEENIDISGLTGKSLCVFEKLKELTLYKRTIATFDNNDNYNLSFQSGGICNNPGEDGCTSAVDIMNGNITIKILNEMTGSLDLAAAILHEGIHAEIYKYVDEHIKEIDPNDRPNLLGYYFLHKADNGSNVATSNAQHQHMADNYITPLAMALRELDNNKYPLDDYLSLAWDGLRAYGVASPTGVEGYFKDRKWTTLDENTSYEGRSKILANTNFNKDCNN